MSAEESTARTGQARSKERRSRVLAAALSLLMSGGSVAVTHRRVAEESDSSPGAVRYYFDTREDLLLACLEHIESMRRAGADRMLREAHSTDLSTEEVARVALAIYFGPDLDNSTVAGAFWGIVDCSRESPRLAAVLAGHRRAAERQLEELLAHGGQSSDTASLLAAVMDGSILSTVLAGSGTVVESAVDELSHILRLTGNPARK